LGTRLAWVCVLCVLVPATLAAQQESGPAFDSSPVVLPQSDSGSPRLVTHKDLLELREIHGLSISPDGKWVAFVVGQADLETNSYRSGLFVVRTSGGESPVCLGSAGLPHWDFINQWISEQPQWSRDSRLIWYRMRMRTDEAWQVWQWNTEGGTPRPLTHVAGDVAKYTRDSSGPKIIMKVELPASRQAMARLFEQGILYDGRILPWEGARALLDNLASEEKKSEIWTHEIDTGIERRATEAEKLSFEPDVQKFQKTFDSNAKTAGEQCHIEKVALAPNGKYAALFCSFDEHDPSGLMRWKAFLVSEDGERRLELAPESNRIADYWWSSDGDSFYFVASQGDGRPRSIKVIETRSGKVREAFHPEEMLQDFSTDAAARWIACTRETNISPPQLAVIDQENGKVKTLVDPNPEFQHLKLSPAERISGVNRYGEEWFGHLVKPAGYEQGKRYPLIVTLYRSGDYFLLGASGNENPIQMYAAHGFVVLSFDVGRNRLRKDADFEGHLLDWASPTASLEMAVQSLMDRGIVDAAKVGLAGLSHGAEILEYAISHTHAFQAAVESGPGARDPYFFYMAGRGWHELFAKWGLGGWPEGESKENWEKLAASLNADRIETPLLVNSADSEFLATLALCSALEELRKPVELYIYPNELHIKNQPRHRYEIYERNLDWFRFWLQAEQDPNPDKREQYSRWQRFLSDQRRNAVR
jgi:dipeptidyl aminopeptidase/acylaminoacyl peptidase